MLVNPIALGVALPFAIAAGLVWYHASGRLEARMRRTARADADRERRRDAGSGPGRGRGPFTRGRGRRATDGRGPGGRRRTARAPTGGPTPADAYRVLGLSPDATDAEVKRAYRARVKEVHPDAGGDEREFRRVTRAYETLID